MDLVETLSPPLSATPRSSLSLGLSARDLAAQIKNEWRQGEPADTRAAINRYPSLSTDKSTVLDLAYEEYCLQLEAGSPPDPDEFCDRFPAFQASLRRLIDAHRFLAENSYLLTEGQAIAWPAPGETFLGFHLVRELGRGAFARVYLATEPRLGDRRVAVKVSLQGGAEAETLGRIRHPNIVTVHSVQEEEASGLSVVCMPYLGSATLCDVLDRLTDSAGLPRRAKMILEAVALARSPDDEAAEASRPDPVLERGSYIDGIVHIAAQLADALACIHDLGICHRDLKPSNVLMSPDGRPMLLDFNLSFDEKGSDNRLGGTLPYMSPEQLLATDLESGAGPSLIDARSDMFSLGMLLYELLTGVHPFGPVPLKLSSRELRRFLLERQRTRPRGIRELNPDVDKALVRIVEQCLEYNPNDRPDSPAQLARDLRRSLSPIGRARRWASLHPGAVAASLVAFLALAGFTANSVANSERASAQSLRLGREALARGDYPQAIEQFSRSLETDSNAGTLMARGRAYQHQGDLGSAIADYLRANKLAPSGEAAAAAAYGYNLINRHDIACELYLQAVNSGWVSPQIYNNLGVCLLQDHRPAEAKHYLDLAIALEPRMQLAYFNRAMVDHEGRFGHPFAMAPAAAVGARLMAAPYGIGPFAMLAATVVGRAEYLPRQALKDLDTAIQIGPPVADLYYWKTGICAVAGVWDSSFREPMWQAMDQAIHLGKDPRPFVSGIEPLASDPRFKEFKSRTVPVNLNRIFLRVVDPYRDPRDTAQPG